MTALVASPPIPPATDSTFIRFPPWPSPPPGVTIIPFKDYAKREVGIKLTCPNPDRVEVDGLDIPTVALEHPHDTDRCKTDAIREDKDGEEVPKAKKRKIKVSADLKREWWETWADEEAGKFTGPYNPKTPAIDRLCQAATDFRMSRTWPAGEPRQLSPTNLFNQFGVFIGLQAIIPTWIRAERRKAEEALKEFKDMVEKSGQNGTQDDDDDEDDDELSDEGDHVGAAPVGVQNGTHDEQTTVEPKSAEDEAEAAAIQEENERKDDRLLAFLNDPETVVKMFLSSYMRKEGLVWADSNLSITPHLLYFFLHYILRNKLLPEYDAGLKKALAVVQCAKVELPRTSDVAKIIPCEVSLALRDQYGSKASQFKPMVIDDTKDEGPEIGKLTNGNIDLDDLDDGQWGDDGNVDYTNDETDPALEESTVEYVGDGEYVDAEQPIDEEGIAKIEEIGDETEPVEDDTFQADTGYNGWNDNGWGGVPMDVDSGTGGVWDAQGSKFQFDDTPAIDWTSPNYSLKNFLGIDTLPESYTTGVVEESVRKIISVHEPTGALEGEFESKLGRIVLAPWNDWDVPKDTKGLDEIRRVYSEIYRGRRIEKGIRRFNLKNEEEELEEDIKSLKPEEMYEEEDGREYSESSNPKIVWESSKGWVVDPDSTNGAVLFSDCTPEKPAPAELGNKTKLHVHDPSNDTIQVLVDPGVIDKLKDVVGLGLGGTFVQLVSDETTKYWYSDKLALVIPSFYVA